MKHRPLARLVILCGLTFGVVIASADKPRFIGDLEAERERWKGLTGVPILIEGRVSTVSRGQLRLTGSRLPVLLRESQRPKAGKNYRIRGVMRLNDRGQPTFVVNTLEDAPSDLKQLRLARSRLKPREPNGWLDLADQFVKRGRFYDDDELLNTARDVEREGLLALIAAAGENRDALEEAGRVASVRNFEGLAAAAKHRAARMTWDDIQPRFASHPETAMTDVAILLDRIGRDLPGASQPNNASREALAPAYQRDPFGMFERADDQQRRLLSRMFYAEIIDGWFESQLDDTASNADKLAERITTLLPDRLDLAAKYHERGITSAMAAVGTMTEAEVTAFADSLIAKQREQDAKTALVKWFEARREGVERKGPAAIVALANDIIRLIGDENAAIELWKRALEIDPKMTSAKDALIARGYEQVGDTWRKKIVLKTPPGAVVASTPVEQGEVREGMTGEAVRRSLRTAPDRVVRIATYQNVSEIWVYDDFKLVLRMLRSGLDKEARVTEVRDLTE